MDIKDILTIIETVSDSDLMKFQLEDGEFKLKLDKTVPQVVQTVPVAPVSNAITAPVAAPSQAAEPLQQESVKEKTDNETAEPAGKIVKSPIVGTFYSAAGPEQPDFVKVGDVVKKGQTLCIIEAMKLMNEIESDFDGEVAEIYVQNEQMVEYGQPLYRLK